MASSKKSSSWEGTYKSMEKMPFSMAVKNIKKYPQDIKIFCDITSKREKINVCIYRVLFRGEGQSDIKYSPHGLIKKSHERIKDLTITIPELDVNLDNYHDLFIYLLASNGKKYCVLVKNIYEIAYIEYINYKHMSPKEISFLGRERGIPAKKKENRSYSGSISTHKKTKTQYTIKPLSINRPRSSFNDYREALILETEFQRKRARRKYKIINGTLLKAGSTSNVYLFEIEDEINLTDDLPISVFINEEEIAGYVINCEGFNIILSLDKNIGQKISEALLEIVSWRLLQAQSDLLDKMDESHVIAQKLKNDGPALSTNNPISSIPKGQDSAEEFVSKNDITVIWGPPGTGKTYTMAKMTVSAAKQGLTVLIVSHSNISVDGAMLAVAEQLRKHGLADLLLRGKALRYGFVQDEKLLKDNYASAYNYVLTERSDLKKRIDELQSKRGKLLSSKKGDTSEERADIETELKNLRNRIRDLEKRYVDEAQIVATTISKVISNKLFSDKKYDIVMFDEISMAYATQVFCAAMFAKRKLVCIGDFRQLSPIIQGDKSKGLKDDLFVFLGILNAGRMYYHPWLVMLNEQRRMHPEISAFSNKYIYGGLLVDHLGLREEREKITNREPFENKAINLINLSGTYCSSMKNNENSRFNIISAIISFQTAVKAVENGEKSVGIIAPYAAQARLIRAMLKDYNRNKENEITCSTVHQFQGSERNVIIFDAVESYPFSQAGYLLTKNTNDILRMINVAVTRARGKLILVSNARFWENKYGDSNHILYKLISHIKENGNEISNKNFTSDQYYHSLPETNNIHQYVNISDAITALKKDINKAKEKIIISIPDAKLDGAVQSEILDLLMSVKKTNNNLSVSVKFGGIDELPDKWRKISHYSENAVFPLMMIDKRIIWYGLPRSEGVFIDGNIRMRTVNHLIYRISGKNAIELINGFSELSMLVVNGDHQALTERMIFDSNGHKIGRNSEGLINYIPKKLRCNVCGSPLKLVRSRKGYCYLKCSDLGCTHIEYLTVDMVNEYIDSEKAACPVHHCNIKARLGRHVVYVKCDEGHTMKPDEI